MAATLLACVNLRAGGDTLKTTKRLTSIRKPVSHPGDVLFDDFMQPLGLTANRLALALHVSRQRIGELLNGRRGITAETSLRLSKFFGTTAKFWLDLQTDYDLSQAEQLWARTIDQEVQPLPIVKQDKSQRKRPTSLKLPVSQKKIYDLLSEKPSHFDALAAESGMDASELARILTMLELSGLVRPHSGNRYSKSLAEN